MKAHIEKLSHQEYESLSFVPTPAYCNEVCPGTQGSSHHPYANVVLPGLQLTYVCKCTIAGDQPKAL